MRIISGSDVRAITRLVAVDQARDPQVETTAAQILADVRRRGDVAVRSWSRKLDGTVPRELTRAELRAGWRATPRDVRSAIAAAIGRVRLVAEAQVPRPFVVDVEPGVRIEQRVAPLARVGCYVPGGRYPLPSTLIMTVVPAVAAGVPDITVVCPRPDATVLCAALEAGATRVLTIGGAQAIGALAYGTASIARVDKIVGPGNAWVAAAKSQVSRECPIDVHAGPSEIVVWSDTGDPEWIALDLLAQAEHDPDARAVFVTTRAPLARAVAEAVRRLMPADGPARTAIRRHGAIVVARSRGGGGGGGGASRRSTWWWTRGTTSRRPWPRGRCLWGTGVCRPPAITRRGPITCCRRVGRHVCAAACPPRTSCGRLRCRR